MIDSYFYPCIPLLYVVHVDGEPYDVPSIPPCGSVTKKPQISRAREE
jgi:hypothetical protein